jgi:hypothetical protein
MMNCRYFDGCSAPRCPRDAGQEHTTWFLDEDICRLADVPEWVKRQRRIARKAAPGRYFTLAMLRHDCRITQGMKGIDPDGTDKERAADEAAWFKAHPVITAEEREKMRESAMKNIASVSGNSNQKTASYRGPDALPGEKGIQVPLNGNTP